MPARTAVVLAPALSVSRPPTGAPTRPLKPAADRSAPAPMAPPGKVSAARTGIVAILAANPKLAPHWHNANPFQRLSCRRLFQSPADSSPLLWSIVDETIASVASCFPTTVSGKNKYITNATTAAALTQRKDALGPYCSTTNPPNGAPIAMPNATVACWAANTFPRSSGTLPAKSASIPRSPDSEMDLPAPSPNRATIRGGKLAAKAVPTSETAMRAMP